MSSLYINFFKILIFTCFTYLAVISVFSVFFLLSQNSVFVLQVFAKNKFEGRMSCEKQLEVMPRSNA